MSTGEGPMEISDQFAAEKKFGDMHSNDEIENEEEKGAVVVNLIEKEKQLELVSYLGLIIVNFVSFFFLSKKPYSNETIL